jgi:Mlc titration factor MtfA (ptsG expression regulator)
MKENTEKQIGEFNTAAAPVFEQMQKVIDYSAEMKKAFEEMSKRLDKSEEEKAQLAIALNASREANMLTAKLLSEVFTCTNVPQYMKDKLVAYYEESKKLIEAPLKAVDMNDKAE